MPDQKSNKPSILKKYKPSYASIQSRCNHEIRGNNNLTTILPAKNNEICSEYQALHNRHLSSKKLFVDRDFDIFQHFGPGSSTKGMLSSEKQLVFVKRPSEICPFNLHLKRPVDRFSVNMSNSMNKKIISVNGQQTATSCQSKKSHFSSSSSANNDIEKHVILKKLGKLKILYGNPEILDHILPGNQNFSKSTYTGIFVVKLYRNAKWYDVIIDDLLPLDCQGRPLISDFYENDPISGCFTAEAQVQKIYSNIKSTEYNSNSSNLVSKQPTGPFVFWNFLVAKALIKFYGSLKIYESKTELEVIKTLTGGYVQEIRVDPDMINLDLQTMVQQAIINGSILVDQYNDLVTDISNFRPIDNEVFYIVHLSLEHLILSSMPNELEEASIRINSHMDRNRGKDTVLQLDGDSNIDCYRLWLHGSAGTSPNSTTSPSINNTSFDQTPDFTKNFSANPDIENHAKIFRKINFSEIPITNSDGFWHLKPGSYLIKNADYCVYGRLKRNISKLTQIEKDKIDLSMKNVLIKPYGPESVVKYWEANWNNETGQAGGCSRDSKSTAIFQGLAYNPQILMSFESHDHLDTFKVKLHLFKLKRCNNFDTGLALYKISLEKTMGNDRNTRMSISKHNNNPGPRNLELSAQNGHPIISMKKEQINSTDPILISPPNVDSNQVKVEIQNLPAGNYVCIPFTKTGEECDFILRCEYLKNMNRADVNFQRKQILKRGRMQI